MVSVCWMMSELEAKRTVVVAWLFRIGESLAASAVDTLCSHDRSMPRERRMDIAV